ncbi:MAG: metallophosphoesterase [Bacteroidaceae bacterium]|nr:metallophosphoesterase [Bacteroidaceae bacterium]
MMKKWSKKQWLCIIAICLVVISVWIVLDNTKIELAEYNVISSKVPEPFVCFEIAQVSDLHNAEFGEGNSNLLALLSEVEPHLIVLTGDLIDSRHTDMDIALDFAGKAVQIAPVFYVSGNHEARVPEYEQLKTGLTDLGVTVLENQKVQITKDGESITLMGIQDPSFRTDYLFGDAESVSRQAITSLQNKSDGFTVLLSHRPELFELYVDTGVDLVFSGHAHGGQFRLPFVGGLVAPNQGFFPKYDAGQFIKENTTMIVSRGVGNSIIPFRINNPPEIVVVELKRQ